MAYKWSHAGLDSSATSVGQFISVTTRRDGRVFASYRRNGSEAMTSSLRFATSLNPAGGTPWSFTTVDGGGTTGSYSSIALANSGPHIAYYESESSDLKHAWYDSTLAHWSTETVDAGISVVGQFTSTATSSPTSTISIAYFDATRPGLKLAQKTGNGLWIKSYIDTVGTVGLYAGFDSAGTQVCYYDLSRRNLKVARANGASWVTSTIDSIGDVGSYCSMGSWRTQTFISYYDATNGNLKFAEKVGAGPWTFTVIDQVGDVGQGTSLEVGPTGRPVIAYYDVTNGDLKYAERFNGTWIVNRVATGGNVGRFNGVFINPSTMLPQILYFDETMGILRYAKGKGEVTGVGEKPPVPLPLLRVTSPGNPVVFPASLLLSATPAASVVFAVFDVEGRLVRTLYEGPLAEGTARFAWDGRDDGGRAVGAGIYFASAATGGARATARLVVVR